MKKETKRVVTSFRCDPKIRKAIEKEAKKGGNNNLSDYLESIVSDRHISGPEKAKAEARKACFAAMEAGTLAIEELQKHGEGGIIDGEMLGKAKFAVSEIFDILKQI